MTPDELARAYVGTDHSSAAETRRQVEAFKAAKPEAIKDLLARLERAEAVRDQLDSAEWLAILLAGLLSAKDRRHGDHEWEAAVVRILRLLSEHFDAGRS